MGWAYFYGLRIFISGKPLMKIKCTNCGHTEKTDKDFFVKLIGGAMPVGGFWAWTTYLFAGTGFAMAIVVAIIGGGIAMLVFKDEIVEWVINEDYKCPKCDEVKWKAYDMDKDEIETSGSDVVSDSAASLLNWLEEEPQGEKEKSIELQKRIDIAEALLRTKGCEFESKETDWLILESSGDLKEINSIDTLEQYAISL